MSRTRAVLAVSSAFITGLAVAAVPVGGAVAASAAPPAATSAGAVAQIATLPSVPGVRSQTPGPNTTCTLPDGSFINFYHCYTPQQIRTTYGVDQLPALTSGPNLGQGQTIVLVDAYGTPTATHDPTPCGSSAVAV